MACHPLSIKGLMQATIKDNRPITIAITVIIKKPPTLSRVGGRVELLNMLAMLTAMR